MGRLGALLSRPQFITVAALVALAALAWVWLFAGAGMEMGPDTHHAGGMMGHEAGLSMPMSTTGWSGARLGLTFAMWWAMMIAMMVPSAVPVVLLYSRASAAANGVEPAATSFVGGYLAVWALFSGGATGLQFLLDRTGVLSSMGMRSQSVSMTAALLFLAGLYQLSPAKTACLKLCRNPAQFISRYFRKGSVGAWRMGAIHGAFCVGCCWALMLLLFVAGVMNLAWVAVLALVVAAEKLLPFGRRLPAISGVLLVIGAIALLVAGRPV